MKIGIDARCLEWERGGVARILGNMLRIWPVITDRHVFYLYFENKIPDDDYLRCLLYQHRIISGPQFLKRHRMLCEQLFLPFVIRQDKLDLFFAPFYTAPLYCPCSKMVVAAWDISYTTHSAHFHWRHGLEMSVFSRAACRRAAGVITCSTYDGRQIEKYYRVPSERIRVLQLAADDKFKRPDDLSAVETLKRKYNLPKRYILSMGPIFNRRNVPVIIDAFKEICREFPDVGMVVAGRNATEPQMDIEGRMQALTERGQGVYISSVPENELALFYAGAWYYISTSTVDGESLMLKEAMKCGTPIITSPLLEETVGGKAVILNDPTNIRETALVLRRALSMDEEERQKNAQEASEWVSLLSWEKVARDCLTFFENI